MRLPATLANGVVRSLEVMYVSGMPPKCCVVVVTVYGNRVTLGKSMGGA